MFLNSVGRSKYLMTYPAGEMFLKVSPPLEVLISSCESSDIIKQYVPHKTQYLHIRIIARGFIPIDHLIYLQSNIV
jgi:hypothetical protein